MSLRPSLYRIKLILIGFFVFLCIIPSLGFAEDFWDDKNHTKFMADHPGVKEFLEAVDKDPALRWGGNFAFNMAGGHDWVHIDDEFNNNNSADDWQTIRDQVVKGNDLVEIKSEIVKPHSSKKSFQVHKDFEDEINKIESHAKTAGVTIFISDSAGDFRKVNSANGATKSNHLIGHAIDMNIIDKNNKICNSTCMLKIGSPKGANKTNNTSGSNKSVGNGGESKSQDDVIYLQAPIPIGDQGTTIENSNSSYFFVYVTKLYRYAAGIAGALAIMMVMIGGLQVAIAGGQSGMVDEGKKRIEQAMIGLALLFTSTILLNTINPMFYTYDADFEVIKIEQVSYKSDPSFKGDPEQNKNFMPTGDKPDMAYKPEDDKLEEALKYKSVYQVAGSIVGVPWPMVSALHWRESTFAINTVSAGNGGQFQGDPPGSEGMKFNKNLKSDATMLAKVKKQFGKEELSEDIFEEAAVIAAYILTTKTKGLTASTTDPTIIKDAFWGYNGKAYGSYDNSPYVMNQWDKSREKMIIKGTTINKKTGKRERLPANHTDKKMGAYTFYWHLVNSLSGSSSNSTTNTKTSSSGKGTRPTSYSGLSTGHLAFLAEVAAERGYISSKTAKPFTQAGSLTTATKADLKKMITAAKKDGITLTSVSDYRSHNDQVKPFFKTTAQGASDAIDEFWYEGVSGADRERIKKKYLARGQHSAPPGYSEHSLGTTVDLNKTSNSFKNTNAYKWLVKNAGTYGFSLSYPEGSTTGAIFEPWHWKHK